jgi:thymidylate synthase (FAD)
MGKLVTPKVYFIGHTVIDMNGMGDYLQASGNDDFYQSMVAAREKGLSDGEILTSFYAKLCYASLTLGKNANVTRVRDIPDNLRATFEQGHLSVWEHVTLNFVVRDCSRVFTHELEPVRDYVAKVQQVIEAGYRALVIDTGLDTMTDFARKKKITSALRRLLPNGQSNEIGFSVNLRAVRHTVQLRTSRHAEWEIREVFQQIYRLVKDKYPLLFHGAIEEEVDGIVEVSGMKMQPY